MVVLLGFSSFPLRAEDENTFPKPQYNAAQLLPNGAMLKTSKGDILIELFPKQAPITVANFQRLVQLGFYDQGLRFHRVVPEFVVQTGDPTNTGAGGSGETIPLEVKNKLSHKGMGVVAMARSAMPDSASSQFYITLAPQPKLDGKYAVFGRVIKGLDVLPRIRQGDAVLSLNLVEVQGVKPDAGAPDVTDNVSDLFKFKSTKKPKKPSV
jgi:cyclophilin family peptidyl-prolyl cis-trans isomerase